MRCWRGWRSWWRRGAATWRHTKHPHFSQNQREMGHPFSQPLTKESLTGVSVLRRLYLYFRRGQSLAGLGIWRLGRFWGHGAGFVDFDAVVFVVEHDVR